MTSPTLERTVRVASDRFLTLSSSFYFLFEKKKGRRNGTQCVGTCIGIKLKDGAATPWKNWDGRKVRTVSVDDVDHIICEHIGDDPASFKLKPETDTVAISFHMMGQKQTIGRIRIKQFGVNSNVATTGHKLQGTSKDKLIVASWNFSVPNWIYVVLSRVRTLKGLFLTEKLDESKPFPVVREVVIEEERLQEIETEVLAKWERRHDEDYHEEDE